MTQNKWDKMENISKGYTSKKGVQLLYFLFSEVNQGFKKKKIYMIDYFF